MSDLELSIPCKSAVNTSGRVIMWALWPVWALLAPVCIVATILAIAVSPIIFPAWMTMALLAGSLAVMLTGAVLTALCEDDRIYLDRSGMSFPIYMLPKLGFRRHRTWEELKEADWRPLSAQHNRLFLSFGSGGKAILDERIFSKSDLEQLLIAIELWGKQCSRSANLLEYQYRLQNENKGLPGLSYTQIWDEEMNRRFSNTTYVPHEPGNRLCDGRLSVVRQIAFGGCSAVYLARREAEQQLVVLKEVVIPPYANADIAQKAKEQFSREAALLMKLQQPSIVQVMDYFVDGGRHYLMLEHVSGSDLRNHLKNNPDIELEQLKSWSLQVAEVLDYLHTQDPPVIHRDLSPDNLMLRRDGSIVVIDFGAANEFVGNATGTLVGKQSYMPPEQLRGKALPESDAYAFGCTLYYLLTGEDPVPLSVSDVSTKKEDVPPALVNLIAGLTAFDPAERQYKVGALKQAVEAAFVQSARSDATANAANTRTGAHG
jgi:tRNA A-37 threonylcarbamoyl transferase component Bud32